MGDRAVNRALESALERAGIPRRVEDGGGEYQGVFNLLRHAFGSRRAAAGIGSERIANSQIRSQTRSTDPNVERESATSRYWSIMSGRGAAW